MSSLSIFKFTDGYYAVGEEGQNKAFIPSWEMVMDICDKNGVHIGLTSDTKIRYLPCTLREYFKGE